LSHELDLREDEEEVFSRFRDSTKRNIRKAIKEGVEVSTSTSEESVSHFYRLNAFTRRRHGLPPQPYSFFKNLHRFILSEGKGFVALALFRQKPVAGATYFHSGEKAYFKYGASDMKCQHLRPNNVVMWSAIQWYCKNKFKSLNFGRTNPEEEGLIQFKSGWGTKENRISYFMYDCGKEAFVTSSDAVYGFHNRVFRMMPMFVLKGVGSSLYKYVG
jgi:lipid II:glycine glycyltransferase (peptidoglycan interpeptide bridge formation enzyme)